MATVATPAHLSANISAMTSALRNAGASVADASSAFKTLASSAGSINFKHVFGTKAMTSTKAVASIRNDEWEDPADEELLECLDPNSYLNGGFGDIEIKNPVDEAILNGKSCAKRVDLGFGTAMKRALSISSPMINVRMDGIHPGRSSDTEYDVVYRERHPVHPQCYLQVRTSPAKFINSLRQADTDSQHYNYVGTFTARIVAPQKFNRQQVKEDMEKGASDLMQKVTAHMAAAALKGLQDDDSVELTKAGLFMYQAMADSFEATRNILPGAHQAEQARRLAARGQYDPNSREAFERGAIDAQLAAGIARSETPYIPPAPPAPVYAEGQGLW